MSFDDSYYFDNQIGKYLIQLMYLFSDLQYKERDTVQRLQLFYGSRDRVTAHMLSDHTQNKLIHLPMASFYDAQIELAPDLRKGVGVEQRFTHLPQGAEFPNGLETVRRKQPVPYRMRVEVTLATSNKLQQRQILEQILMIFDPVVQIQSTDRDFDWQKLTYVELESIGNEENYPPGIEPRVIVKTLSFVMPIYISAPLNFKNQFVSKLTTKLIMGQSDDDFDDLFSGAAGQLLSSDSTSVETVYGPFGFDCEED